MQFQHKTAEELTTRQVNANFISCAQNGLVYVAKLYRIQLASYRKYAGYMLAHVATVSATVQLMRHRFKLKLGPSESATEINTTAYLYNLLLYIECVTIAVRRAKPSK